MKRRASKAAGLVWRVASPLVLSIAMSGCEPQAYDAGEAFTPESVPAEARVSKLEVFPGERREGMCKVRVTLETIAGGDGGGRSLTITEWVPLVLLRRLAVGAKVGLASDPHDKNRPTLAL
jgi:hypothetical protein